MSSILIKSIQGYWISTHNEWYKAAFYDPTLNSGAGGYWAFATQSNVAPSAAGCNAVGNGSVGNTGNFANIGGVSIWDGSSGGNVTTVGTNGGPSYYGTYDTQGNVSEWVEDLVRGQGRVVSGSYGSNPNNWNATTFQALSARNVAAKSTTVGFRISTITNPISLSNLVVVGNPNNSSNTTGLGSVPYTYSIGKYEVTNNEYVEFLNAVAATDTYSLYDSLMSGIGGGINRSGSSGSYSYTVKTNYSNKPVNCVSWLDCARYCNWLTNGKPSGQQNNSTTENGRYRLFGINPSYNNIPSSNAIFSETNPSVAIPIRKK